MWPLVTYFYMFQDSFYRGLSGLMNKTHLKKVCVNTVILYQSDIVYTMITLHLYEIAFQTALSVFGVL